MLRVRAGGINSEAVTLGLRASGASKLVGWRALLYMSSRDGALHYDIDIELRLFL